MDDLWPDDGEGSPAAFQWTQQLTGSSTTAGDGRGAGNRSPSGGGDNYPAGGAGGGLFRGNKMWSSEQLHQQVIEDDEEADENYDEADRGQQDKRTTSVGAPDFLLQVARQTKTTFSPNKRAWTPIVRLGMLVPRTTKNKNTDRCSGAAPVNAAGGGVILADAEGTRTTPPAAKPKAVDKNFSSLSSRRFQPEYTGMTAATLPVYTKETVTTERLLLVPQEKIIPAPKLVAEPEVGDHDRQDLRQEAGDAQNFVTPPSAASRPGSAGDCSAASCSFVGESQVRSSTACSGGPTCSSHSHDLLVRGTSAGATASDQQATSLISSSAHCSSPPGTAGTTTSALLQAQRGGQAQAHHPVQLANTFLSMLARKKNKTACASTSSSADATGAAQAPPVGTSREGLSIYSQEVDKGQQDEEEQDSRGSFVACSQIRWDHMRDGDFLLGQAQVETSAQQATGLMFANSSAGKNPISAVSTGLSLNMFPSDHTGAASSSDAGAPQEFRTVSSSLFSSTSHPCVSSFSQLQQVHEGSCKGASNIGALTSQLLKNASGGFSTSIGSVLSLPKKLGPRGGPSCGGGDEDEKKLQTSTAGPGGNPVNYVGASSSTDLPTVQSYLPLQEQDQQQTVGKEHVQKLSTRAEVEADNCEDDDAVDPKAESFESVLSAAEAEQAGQLQQKQLQQPAGPEATAGQAGAARGGGGGAAPASQTHLVRRGTSRENKAQDDLSPLRALLQKCAAPPSTLAPSAAGVVLGPLQASTACSAPTQQLPVQPPPRGPTGTSGMILIKRRSSSSTTAVRKKRCTVPADEAEAHFSRISDPPDENVKSFLGTPAAKRLAVLLDHKVVEQAGTTNVDAAASSASLSTRRGSISAARDSSKNVIPQRVVLPAQTEIEVEPKTNVGGRTNSSENSSRLRPSKPGTVQVRFLVFEQTIIVDDPIARGNIQSFDFDPDKKQDFSRFRLYPLSVHVPVAEGAGEDHVEVVEEVCDEQEALRRDV
ncbi:unnamed protein product [Amoebophrya sp. A120]|nr:unnamed protein product [Amoebophrya sp. A120]|eukprot:GSA120T00008593001.1